MADVLTSPIPEQDVRSRMEGILASPNFVTSDRNRRFLRHVVEETLAGRGNRIKAYTIATSVFGRAADFDPLRDSIVRIEAARLRRAMERFYLLEGEAPGLRLLLPKGSYVPQFVVHGSHECQLPVQAPTTPALHDSLPRVLVERFEQQGGPEGAPAVAQTLQRQTISALTRFTELIVHGQNATDHGPQKAGDQSADFSLSGAVVVCQDRISADLLLRHMPDGRYIWAQSVTCPAEECRDAAQILSVCNDIAGRVAREIALRDTTLDSQIRGLRTGPDRFRGYRTLLHFHEYWRNLDPARLERTRSDLEAAIAEDPHFSAAFSCLSLLLSAGARFGPDAGPNPQERALLLAKEAVRLSPRCSRAHHARSNAEWLMDRPEAAAHSLETAQNLNPNDPELLAEQGLRHAMRMEWEAALPLLTASYRCNPQQATQYRLGFFLHHFATRNHEQALREADGLSEAGPSHAHLAAAAALAELNRLDDARSRLKRMNGDAEPGGRSPEDDPAFRHCHPDLIAALRHAFRKLDLDRRDRGGKAAFTVSHMQAVGGESPGS